MVRVARAVEVEEVAVEADSGPMLLPVSFDLDAGEALAVTGPNGAGKTTLLRVLTGTGTPSTGRARVAGIEVDERDRRFRRLVSGSVGRPPVARDLTLEEHLSLIAASWGADVGSARRRAARLLDDLGMAALAQRFPHELSSGQSQLFSLAVAVCRPFDVLVLDEPEQRLDADRRRLVAGLLAELLTGGRTVVFATHSPELVDAVADRTLELAGHG